MMSSLFPATEISSSVSLWLLAAAWFAFWAIRSSCFVSKKWPGVPRAPRASWLAGNRRVRAKDPSKMVSPHARIREYYDEYQTSTFVFPDVCGTDKLYTKDPKIMYAVLNDIHTFVAEPVIQEMMRLVSGGGIISAFGEEHRRMRKIVSPSFATGNLRAMLPTVTKHTAALCEQLDTLLERGGGGKWKGAVNVASLLDFTALSVIAEAGFGYNVDEQSSSVESDSSNALLDDRVAQNELARTYSETVQAALQGGLQMVILMAAARVTGSKLISLPVTSVTRTLLRQKKTIDRIAKDIFEAKTRTLDGLSRQDIEQDTDRDLLSAIVKTNRLSKLDDGPKRTFLTDDELIGQIQSFLFAGFETTSTTFAWCLWHIAGDTRLQEDLYQEITGFLGRDTTVSDLTYDKVWSDELDLMSRVIAETLRVHPPVAAIERTVKQSTVLPTQSGFAKSASIHTTAGDHIVIDVASFGFDANYFGPDVDEFRPDRWLNLPEENKRTILPPIGSMAFSTGPKGCIGSKFAQTEMRVFLLALIPRFCFRRTDHSVIAQPALVTRPAVLEDGAYQVAMPLFVERR